ncbi:MAG: 5'-deoxyadenosine deaminase [Acidobacteriota bacterium]|nr:5'-deoxyadenosine deaminase [Acidobacteriota bacterium]
MVPPPQGASLTGPHARQPRVGGLRISGATIVTMNDAFDVVEGDVLVRDGRFVSVGQVPASERVDRVIDANGAFLLPGFIQTHIHLCQTLFRGYADDLALLDWLKQRVWPMEAAHTPASLAAAAQQAASELLLSGTTTVLTMETVHDTDAVFAALEPMGLRAVVGKCMMDADDAVPARLLEKTASSLDESVAIAKRWHGRANGRLRAAFAPRFAVSCSQALLEAVASLSLEHGLVVHTHASENRDEVALIRERTGRSNIDYLAHTGLASPRLCLAHCVWVDDHEQSVMAEHDVKVLHCPGSNLKLGSGLAPVVEMRAKGISVSLGADGAACNNHLDMFGEMRLAAVLQSVRKGPGALTARDALWMATREGARALGLGRELGSIEAGKRADFLLVDRDRPQFMTSQDPYSALVYSARGSDVRTTVVDGEVLVDGFRPIRWDQAQIAAEARLEAARLAGRAGF